MIQEIISLQTETLVLIAGLVLVLANALVAALRSKNWFKQGRDAMSNEDTSSAIYFFSQEILNHPENADAYFARAEAYRANGELEKAVADERKGKEMVARSIKTGQKQDHSLSPSF